MKNVLDQSAVNAGSSPSPTRIDTRIPGIKFDPAAPPNPGAPAGSPPAGGAPAADGAGSPPAGSAAGSPPAGSVIDWKTAPAQLRTEYEQTKAKLEPWEKLGAKPDEVAQHYSVAAKMYKEATDISTELGYNPDDVKAAYQKDPVATLAFLRQQKELAAGSDPSKTDPLKTIEKRLSDFEKKEQARELNGKVNRAMELYGNEFDRIHKAAYPDGAPDELTDVLDQWAYGLLLQDHEAVQRLREEGKVSDIAKFYDQARNLFVKAHQAWLGHEQKRTGGRPPGTPPGDPKERKLSTGQSVKELFENVI